MYITKEELEIFEKTGAGPAQADSILKAIEREDMLTPEKMYASAKSMCDKMGLSRAEMITAFKIDLINRAGGGDGKLHIRDTPKPTEAAQQHTTEDPTEDPTEAAYNKHKGLYKGLGLSKEEALQAIREA